MKIGISLNSNPREAAIEAVGQASQAAPVPTLAIVFGSIHLQQNVRLAVLQPPKDRYSAAFGAYGGDVDKYMGDCIFAGFHEKRRAVEGGCVFCSCLRRCAPGETPFNLRLGINAGRVIRANVGATERRVTTIKGKRDPGRLRVRFPGPVYQHTSAIMTDIVEHAPPPEQAASFLLIRDFG